MKKQHTGLDFFLAGGGGGGRRGGGRGRGGGLGRGGTITCFDVATVTGCTGGVVKKHKI